MMVMFITISARDSKARRLQRVYNFSKMLLCLSCWRQVAQEPSDPGLVTCSHALFKLWRTVLVSLMSLAHAAPDAPNIQDTNTQNSLLARNLGDIFDCSITSTQNSLLAGCMWRAGGVPGVRMASMRTTCEHARQPRVCECRQDYQEPEFETVGACLIMIHGISDAGANFLASAVNLAN